MFRKQKLIPTVNIMFSLYSARRKLYNFRIPRPEIVIGNNTAIFATLNSLRKHGNLKHPNLTVICPEFWLDSTHSDYNSLSWGQTIYGLPKFIREMFLKIYPNYPEDKRITWGEYQQLRQAAIHELKEQNNVTFIHGMPDIIEPHHQGFNILVNPTTHKFNNIAPPNSFFYNWGKAFRKHDLSDIVQRPHTQLYNIARDKLPKNVVVLGHGLSVDWIAEHFPSVGLINLKQSTDKRDIIPANEHINFDRVLVLDLDDVIVKPDLENPNNVMVSLTVEPHKTYIGEFYNAVGIKSLNELTSKISRANKEEFPINYKIENWVAPKNIRFGSLMENFAKWIEITGNLSWAHEPQAYHSDHFPIFLREKMNDKGVILSNEFFNILEDQIKKLDNPLNDLNFTNMLTEIFSKSKKFVSINELAAFKECLNEINKERELDNNHINTSKKPGV